MNMPPTFFSEEIYKEVKDIIRRNINRLKPDAEDALNHAAGGSELFAAMNPLQFPPCIDDGNCTKCWMQKRCIHSKTSLSTREALVKALGVFTTPNLKIHDRALERIKTADKTNAVDIKVILTVAQYYQNHPELIEKEEKKQDDKPKDS